MSFPSKAPLFSILAMLASATPLAAQQFVNIPAALPGPDRWSEGVVCTDVDLDGDLDILFANGEGFATAGPKRPATLLINQTIGLAGGFFTDESAARLGVQISNAKAIVAGDVTGDGYPDLLIANAYNTDIPYLLINRGISQPGFFDFESIPRGFNTSLNSNCAAMADVDSDGDLDILLSDSGLSFFGGLGDKPRLYRNNSGGYFTYEPDAIVAPAKVAQMDIQMADVDGDFDLDFIGLNRASNLNGHHYLLLNDGTGTFTDSSDSISMDALASYAMEPSDLDLDGDVDLFAAGLAGTQPGVVENGIMQGGAMFTARAALSGSIEDRDVALFDWDNDNDYDVILGARSTDELTWKNDGALSFASETGLLPATGDSTLAIAVADLDNDGAYDLVTAQGQDNAIDWENKIYHNTGDADTLPPTVVDVQQPNSVLPTQDVVVLAKVSDQVMDDGVTYVTGRAFSVAPFGVNEQLITLDAVTFSPGMLTIPAGTKVTWTNVSGADQTVTSTSGPSPFAKDLPTDETVERVFVRPGVYNYMSNVSGAMAQIVVTGTVVETEGTYSGGGIHRFAMPDSSFGAGIQLHYELEFTDWPGNMVQTEPSTVLLGNCSSSNVCMTSPNSIGDGAIIGLEGSTSIAANNFKLVTNSMPRGAAGVYFFGPNQIQVPLGDGFRCVGGGITRLGVVFSDIVGHAELDIDLSSPVGLGGVATAGSVWFFQHWYRDIAPDRSSTTNLSDALRVSFCP